MAGVLVRNKAWVLVGDGRRALFLINEGDAAEPDLRVLETLSDANPATHEQGSGAPGRSFSSVGAGRSAVQQTDWHQLEEEHFARGIAERINAAAEAGAFAEIVIVAPPRALGDLRQHLSKHAQAKLAGEWDRDLTRHPLPEIAKALARR